MRQYLQAYFAKMRGGGNPSPHALNWRNALCSWLGSFLGMAAIAYLNSYADLTQHDHFFLIGSFGATAVLLFSAPSAPFAQPSHVMGGHLVGAFIGVSVYRYCPEPLWFSTALAVSLATLLMYLTRTIHPPGGGTALIAVIGSDKVHALGYWYVLDPVLLGVCVLVLMALLVNNLSPLRKYPNYW